jgi:hypothetical protein
MKDTTELLPHIRLDFNINHPSVEECYVDGYASAAADAPESANPFKYGSIEARQWSDGWWAGFYGEEPLFDLKNIPVEDLFVATSKADNDESFFSPKINLFLLRFLEISGAIAVSALIGYQLVELVA